MSAQLAFFAVDILAAFSAALVGLRALTLRPRLPVAQLIAFMAFNAICDVILERSEYRYWIPPPLQVDIHGGLAVVMNLARNITPFLFALLCHVLFIEGRRFPRWLFGLLAVQLFLEEPVHLLLSPGAPLERLITQTAPASLQTLFIGFALYWTLADWRGDLVEMRRRTRLLIFFIIGVDMIVSGLGVRAIVNPDIVAAYYLHVALVFSHLVLGVFVLFLLMDSEVVSYLDPLRPPAPQPEPESPDASALARLAALMAEERLYRRPGLTLKDVAAKAQVPEYRLRRLIHEELGYTNFNAFLHAWRVREACHCLRDPEQRRTPILTIALSVGYQSVNTFNRGFREVMATTPSEWRAREEAPLPPDPAISAPKTG